MSKLIPIDILSSIKGAKPSDSVNKLFDVIKGANLNNWAMNSANVVLLNELRADIVENCSEETKNIIKENFPIEKEGYLVVSKVIED